MGEAAVEKKFRKSLLEAAASDPSHSFGERNAGNVPVDELLGFCYLFLW